MLKIVVFDGGWGGELVARYLDCELGVVEVVRVIDWSGEYHGKDSQELAELVGRKLKRYIFNSDVIVLAGYVFSGMAQILTERFPGQKFIDLGIDYARLMRTRNKIKQVGILAGEDFVGSGLLQELRNRLPEVNFILPHCGHWETLIDENRMSMELLRSELSWDFAVTTKVEPIAPKMPKLSPLPLGKMIKLERACQEDMRAGNEIANTIHRLEQESSSRREAEAEMARNLPFSSAGEIKLDAVLILNTHFWEIKPTLEEIFGWRVRVLDFREKLFRDVCAMLGLQGLDGNRPK